MPQTDRLGFKYPTENEDPFYETFRAMMNQVDSYIYTAIENLGIVLRGGGLIELNGDTFSWSEKFEILSLSTGGIITIDPDSLTVVEGKVIYIDVPRPIQGVLTRTLKAADTILATDTSKLFVGIRRSGKISFRNQLVDISNLRGSAKKTTGSIASGGGSESGYLSIGFNYGVIQFLKVTALSDTVNSDIQFYSDAGMTIKVYEKLGEDCYTSAYEDLASWFTKDLTDGKLYYKITNNGANPSAYEIETVGFGKVAV